MSTVAVAVETTGLGKRFGRRWALQDCSIQIPAGRVCGLVGANGAGKTTLLRLLAGLSTPSAGEALVNGQHPSDDPAFLRGIGFLAQDVPLYRRWTGADHLAFGAHMNDRWDEALASDRLLRLGIPLDRPVEKLSGGMRAQVALAVAMGKRPELLLLDEPVAALDPLARREFLGSLAAAIAEGDLTVVLSSHLLPDLERICDHLVVIADARPVLCAGIDELLASHKRLRAPARRADGIGRQHHVITESHTPRETTLVVELHGPLLDPAWEVEDIGLEDIVLAYLTPAAPAAPLELAGIGGPT